MTTAIYGNSLYEIVEGPTWEQAQSNASKIGGNLATILDEYENLFLANSFSNANFGYTANKVYLNPLFESIEEDIYWIGLTKESGSWAWVTGESLANYENWGPLEPFQDLGIEDRATMITQGYLDVYAPWVESAGNWDNNLGEWYGIAEIPLNLSADLPASVEEGTEFTVDINLTAGTTSSELTQGISIWYTYEITGVNGNGDSDVYSVTGSGQIDTNGQFDDGDDVAGFQITIDKDWVFDDDLFRLTFYSDDPSGTGSELGFTDAVAYRDAIQIDVDQAEGGEIIDGVVVADILSIPDPITGIFDGPGTVNLNNKGVTPFTLFGSGDIDVEDIDVDSLVFGGEDSGIGVAVKKNGTLFAAYEDVNGDEILDLVVKVETSAFAGVAPTEPFEVFGSFTDETQVVFGLNESDSINFIA